MCEIVDIWWKQNSKIWRKINFRCGAIYFLLLPWVFFSYCLLQVVRHSLQRWRDQLLLIIQKKFFSDSSLHLIYIKAFNCKFCEKFSERAIPNFKKTKIASKIYFTTIEVDDFRVPYESTAWPDYLKWVLKKAKFENCGPQFIAIKGHTILGIFCNIKGFRSALKLLKSHLNWLAPTKKSGLIVSALTVYGPLGRCSLVLATCIQGHSAAWRYCSVSSIARWRSVPPSGCRKFLRSTAHRGAGHWSSCDNTDPRLWVGRTFFVVQELHYRLCAQQRPMLKGGIPDQPSDRAYICRRAWSLSKQARSFRQLSYTIFHRIPDQKQDLSLPFLAIFFEEGAWPYLNFQSSLAVYLIRPSYFWTRYLLQ